MLSLLTALVIGHAVTGDVSHPHPGVTLARDSSAALVIVDLCAPGVSVRATRYAERKATPSGWAKQAGVDAEVAINADFFDFPAATLVIGRARGAGEDWPANKQLFEVRSYFQFGPGGALWQPSAAVVPPASANEIVGGHNTLIVDGVSQGPGFDGDPTVVDAHRRTAVGLSADRKTLFMFVSDQALGGAAMVAKMRALASEAGAPAIDDAANMDGGGSSQLYIKGIGPIFETGRLVANHLGVQAEGSGPAPHCPVPACTSTCSAPAADRVSGTAAPVGLGYWIVTRDGALQAMGNASFRGSLLGQPLNQPIVGIAATPSGAGYWLVAADGGVFAFGDAGFLGSMGGQPLNAAVVGLAATPSGRGYWLVGADGGLFAFGDAGFYGSMASQALNAPIVGIAATPSGHGYWMVAKDGGIFAFGDAGFYGSMGGQALNAPVVGMAARPDGGGYWLVAADGGIFAFDAGFYGSAGGAPLNQPVVAVAATPSGAGYWLFAADGGVFAYGDAPFLGSALSDHGCDGASTILCRQDPSGCWSWHAQDMCAAGASCRNGQCEATCSDECQAGDQRCVGDAVAGCGERDADPCRDWLGAMSCEAGKQCSGDACASPSCSDACLDGARRCAGGAVERCAVAGDGCRVWVAEVTCLDGETCSDGACVPGATPVDEEPVVEETVVEEPVMEETVVAETVVEEPDVEEPVVEETDVDAAAEPTVDEASAAETSALEQAHGPRDDGCAGGGGAPGALALALSAWAWIRSLTRSRCTHSRSSPHSSAHRIGSG